MSRSPRSNSTVALLVTILVSSFALSDSDAAPKGYYRHPALHADRLVFTAEGDLWSVAINGGTARRLTTHLGEEAYPAISPDGTRLAFSATYEGPQEVYVMPIDGGLPTRLTYHGRRAQVMGWTPDGDVLYRAAEYSTLPDYQLITVNPENGNERLIPLAQASDGVVHGPSRTLYFVRQYFQGSHTRRYEGGTTQNLWKFNIAQPAEAVPLTADFDGTSKDPMIWRGRLYFASDRDGTMNIWSMRLDGGDLRQHTNHVEWEIKDPAMGNGRIAYQHGADIRVFSIDDNSDREVPITLTTDFDQMREKWITSPMDWVTSSHISADGTHVALTARGQVFVAPVKPGRIVEATPADGVRHRDARFMPDGTQIITLSDQSGEVEPWLIPANGIGEWSQLLSDGEVLRWEAIPSPDGRWIAHHDKNQRLWILDQDTGENRLVQESANAGYHDLRWSPDSRWLAFVTVRDNQFNAIMICEATTGDLHDITSDRYESYSPAWSPDGKWFYFLSDRNLESLVRSPWGSRQPDPFFDRQTQVFMLPLVSGLRSPFLRPDELSRAADEAEADSEAPAPEEADDAEDDAASEEEEMSVEIEFEGLHNRLQRAPVSPGNYGQLVATEKRLMWVSWPDRHSRDQHLMAIDLTHDDPEAKTIVEGAGSYEMSGDGSSLLIRKDGGLFVIDSGAGPGVNLQENRVPLGNWSFRLDPATEWSQMFIEAWRLERDYFYDRGMHGVDWLAMLARYEPLVARVRTRAELSDLIASMVSELSALHTFVYGGDMRGGSDNISVGRLGARWHLDRDRGGYVIDHVYQSDPDDPDRRAPLAEPHVNVVSGDVVTAINGMSLADEPFASRHLRAKVGAQVRLSIVPGDGSDPRDVIVTPIGNRAERDLRYHEWEYTRRLRVEDASEGGIGYVHLRAMGGGDIAQWARDFYPVFDRKGLIIDVRHNGGGNIDSWILGKLLRKAWFYWQPRVGSPTWNMQYAFRGHMVVLCDAQTGSDGEAFAEGFRRLGLGKVIGTRTWGGEIWLTSSNVLVDNGIATAAEFGVYGPEGVWLIEGRGVEPDMIVDNTPYATFQGQDAQLQAAIAHLEALIAADARDVPETPPHPDKSGP